jgi:hypothetical protein
MAKAGAAVLAGTYILAITLDISEDAIYKASSCQRLSSLVYPRKTTPIMGSLRRKQIYVPE